MCRDEQQNQAPGDSHTGRVFQFLFATHARHLAADRRTAVKWLVAGLPVSQTLLEYAETERKDKTYTLVDIFKTPNIRKLSICIGLIW